MGAPLLLFSSAPFSSWVLTSASRPPAVAKRLTHFVLFHLISSDTLPKTDVDAPLK
jgi:hypothetical protein